MNTKFWLKMVLLLIVVFAVTYWLGNAIQADTYSIVDNQPTTPDTREIKCTHVLQEACYR